MKTMQELYTSDLDTDQAAYAARRAEKLLNMSRSFRLIGRTVVFTITREYMVCGTIRCVKGVSLCGKYQTCARIADVEFLS